jgi:hypothetical protein
VALSNLFPQAKSVAAWLRHGWYVAVAYVAGFFVLLVILHWHPNAPHKERRAAGAAPAMEYAVARAVSYREVALRRPKAGS